MFRKELRRDLRTIVLALVAGLLGANAPAIAHGVNHAVFAHSADAVDGFSAVGSDAGNKKTKLVATSSAGKLPRSIIPTVKDADRLGGRKPGKYARKIWLSRILELEEYVETTVIDHWEKLADLGVFTKKREQSDILLDWDEHATAPGDPSFCHFQLRVDGEDDDGYSGDECCSGGGNVAVYGTDVPFHVTNLFRDLEAGEHTVEVWVRGNASSCGINKGFFNSTVIIQEI